MPTLGDEPPRTDVRHIKASLLAIQGILQELVHQVDELIQIELDRESQKPGDHTTNPIRPHIQEHVTVHGDVTKGE